MLRGLFVTGTDTGIGKTVMSAALLVRYRSLSLRYWKPIQTGIEQDDDTRTVRALAGSETLPLCEGVRLQGMVSPHLAARLAGRRLDVEPLLAVARAQADSDRFVVEGAGGVLVPINESTFMVDLIRALALPALVVARSTLGTINHTVLTVEALRARGIVVAGVIMNGPRNESNRAAIEAYGATKVIGQVAPFDRVDSETVNRMAEDIDPDGALLEYLRG